MEMKRTSLFDTSHISEIPKETIKEIQADFRGEDKALEYYKIHKNKFPIPYHIAARYDKETLTQIVHSSIYYFLDNHEKVTKNKADVDTRDLANFLNTHIDKAYDPHTQEYLRSTKGLGFLNSFIKEHLLSVEVAGKGPNIYERMKNIKWLYKVMCKALTMKAGFSVNGIFSTLKLVDTQTVSNIRPLSMAHIYHTFGIKRTEGKDTLNILTTSEGWLGRLLASYYIAYHNPMRVINYHTIDPNPNVVETFPIVVDFLQNYGGINKVKNWFPKIHQQGSEEPLNIPEGTKFDIIGTSPPYGFQEEYTAGREVVLRCPDGKEEHKSIAENKEFLINGQTKKVGEAYTGDSILIEDVEYKIVKTFKSKQSHSKNSVNHWNEGFFRPTVINMQKWLSEEGVMWWNVANVRTHKTLEQDVVDICIEEGMTLIQINKYQLSRVPGGAMQKDGTRKNIRDVKRDHEPVFIFLRGTDTSQDIFDDYKEQYKDQI